MSCLQLNLTPGALPAGGAGVAQPISPGGAVGNIPLMVSDNPESVSLLTTGGVASGVLWEHEIGVLSGPVKHRIFLWHINGLGANHKLGITLAATGPNAVAVAVRRETNQTAAGYFDLGLCIAKALLADSLDPGVPPIAPIDPIVSSGTVGLVEEMAWTNTWLRGAEYELTLDSSPVPSQPFGYKIRTTFGPSATNLRALTGTPVPRYTDPMGRTHPRGSWSQSEIAVDCHCGFAPNGASTGMGYFPIAAGSGADFVFRQTNSQNPIQA